MKPGRYVCSRGAAGSISIGVVVSVLACILTANAFAEITVLDTAISTEKQGTYIGTDVTVTWSAASFGSFSLIGADKLVVTFGTAHSGLPAANRIKDVVYNGKPMTEAVGAGPNTYYESAIFYLDSPGSTTGNLVATMNRGYGAGVTIWALSGTGPGIGATAASESKSTSLTTSNDNSIVIAHSTVAGDPAAPVAQSPLTSAHSFNVLYEASGGRNHSIGTGYQTVATKGSVITPTFDIGNVTVAAEIVPPPPPAGTLILIR